MPRRKLIVLFEDARKAFLEAEELINEVQAFATLSASII